MKPLPPLALILTLVFCVSPINAQEVSVVELTNADILTNVCAKLPAELIVAKIKSSRCHFDTYPSVLAELKYRGVADSIIVGMVEAPVGVRSKPVEEPRALAPSKPIKPSNTEQPTSPAEAKPTNNVGRMIRRDKSQTPFNARFFMTPMEEGFDGLISALMIEKKLPLSIVIDENLADFIVVGGTNKGTRKWYDTVFGSGIFNR